MTKRRIRIKRRDGIKQRYWVGKKLRKRNFAGGLLFQEHLLKERGIKIKGKPQLQKQLFRQLEKRPEHIQHLKYKAGVMFETPINTTIIADPDLGKKNSSNETPVASYNQFGLISIDPRVLKGGVKTPHGFLTTEEIFAHEVGHAADPNIGSTLLIVDKKEAERFAHEFQKTIPERKRKVQEEKISKSFREIIK